MSVPKLYKGTTLISPRRSGLTVVSTPRTSSTDASIPFVSVSTSVTANTKGSWVEIIASAAGDADELVLLVRDSGASGASGGNLFDVGVGGAGAETVLVPNVPVSHSTLANTVTAVRVPVAVAAGTRLSVRWQSARSSASAADVSLQLLADVNGVRSPTSIDSLGANTASSVGVTLASNNTWAQVEASATRDYQGFVVCPVSVDSAMATSQVTFDIGVGGSGSEIAHLCPQVWLSNTQEELRPAFGSNYIAAPVATGERIAARVIDTAIVTNAGYSVVLLGVPA